MALEEKRGWKLRALGSGRPPATHWRWPPAVRVCGRRARGGTGGGEGLSSHYKDKVVEEMNTPFLREEVLLFSRWMDHRPIELRHLERPRSSLVRSFIVLVWFCSASE